MSFLIALTLADGENVKNDLRFATAPDAERYAVGLKSRLTPKVRAWQVLESRAGVNAGWDNDGLLHLNGDVW